MPTSTCSIFPLLFSWARPTRYSFRANSLEMCRPIPSDYNLIAGVGSSALSFHLPPRYVSPLRGLLRSPRPVGRTWGRDAEKDAASTPRAKITVAGTLNSLGETYGI